MPRQPVETKAPAERAILVFVNMDPGEDFYAEEELTALCHSAGVIPVAKLRQRIEKPNPATFLGSGKVQELFNLVHSTGADVVLVDAELNATQQRNLAEELRCRVVDRPQLILDIFARRAHTREGKLQVELAQLTYLLPKVTAVYTKFERQRGGIGLRGPGEAQLESDKRRIKERIIHLEEELEEVRQQRTRQRSSRRKRPFPFATIVGYTSAGKSTLMNALTGSEVLVDPQLFATLDPTTRRVELPQGYSVFLTDTVGFVRRLPAGLISAFRATLEEVKESDFLIHVVDISHPLWQGQRETVLETLTEIGAGERPILTAFNKCDRLSDQSFLRDLVSKTPYSVAISALRGEGLGELLDVMVKMIRSFLTPVVALIPYEHAGLVQECYDYGRVLYVEHREEGIFIKAELVSDMIGRLQEHGAIHVSSETPNEGSGSS
ncbi:MAG: GTPase HflX [Candidatus Caldarchaeum sp.]